MPLPIEDVLNMIADNTRRRGSPVPISEREIYGWADGLSIPRVGILSFSPVFFIKLPHI